MWDINQNRRLIYGNGSAKQIGAVAKSLAVTKALVLAYSADAVGVKDILQTLSEQKISYHMDDSIRTEPSTTDVDRLVGVILEHSCDGVVAIGGGSILDAAKAAAMIATNGGLMEQYQMEGRPVTRFCLPLVAVPTTAGTGSEATRVSVVYNPNNRLKKSIYSPYMIADAAVLDPELTVSLPAAVTVSTGVDAFSHAVESYVSLNATPYTEMMGLKAMSMILDNLPRCVENGGDLEARGNLLLASYFAGAALNAGIGLAHMIAQPLGGLLHIPHGEACAIYLPHAMRYNVEHSIQKYCEIARVMGAQSAENTAAFAREGIERVEAWLRRLNAPSKITAYLPEGFDMDETVTTVQAATGHIQCNPRPMDAAAIRSAIESTL